MRMTPRYVDNVNIMVPPKSERAYHHGDLRNALIEAGLAALEAQDASELSLRALARELGVSANAVYRHFADKDACFLELYRAASASALRTLSDAVQPDRPWQDQVEHALGAYLAHLAGGAQLLRMLFVEIHHLGPAGAQVRREVMQHLADFMLHTINAQRTVLTPTMAMAAVGGIQELVLLAIERGEAARLDELTASASAVVRLLARV